MERVAATTPPNDGPSQISVAARHLCRRDEIYVLGGVQAVHFRLGARADPHGRLQGSTRAMRNYGALFLGEAHVCPAIRLPGGGVLRSKV
ncbi:hypothetical protein LHJ74_16660 [Streptomyces sp. N2-109]|uniref:Uncharacterized protein n=2 Tax=Streptomyces gossypii TaxID=2883101 RepID=A0ABT2JUD5_9ACTN|nr:hypothetical protein [Streptomyces gossypii]